jgi:hypothetical protein
MRKIGIHAHRPMIEIIVAIAAITIPASLALFGCGRCTGSNPAGPSLGVTSNAITMNALTTNALTTNADRMSELLRSELESDSFGPGTSLGEALWDPNAQQLMAYLVSCALPPGEEVTWQPPPTNPPVAPVTWRGALGLCPQWRDRGVAGDASCQELVSSCLLARNNAFGVEVPISIRGFDTGGGYFGAGTLDDGRPEYEAYPWREGSFYGNMFLPGSIHEGLRVEARRAGSRVKVVYHLAAAPPMPVFDMSVSDYAANSDAERRALREAGHRGFGWPATDQPVVVYENAFACWSPEWSAGDAYLHQRVCAGPIGAQRCVAWAVGACTESDVHPQAPGLLCQKVHEPNVGYFDFDDCAGTAAAAKTPWPFPITVFLRDRCAIVEDPRLCARRDANQQGDNRSAARARMTTVP